MPRPPNKQAGRASSSLSRSDGVARPSEQTQWRIATKTPKVLIHITYMWWAKELESDTKNKITSEIKKLNRLSKGTDTKETSTNTINEENGVSVSSL